MNKIIFSALALASIVLVGCSNDNFNATEEFKTNMQDTYIKDEAKRAKVEKNEGENLTRYHITGASNGIYSLCLQKNKNYVVYSNGEPSISMALDLNEDPIPCDTEGKFENVLNNLAYGIQTYCSKEKIFYYVIHQQSYQFYPIRDLKFKLVSCERK